MKDIDTDEESSFDQDFSREVENKLRGRFPNDSSSSKKNPKSQPVFEKDLLKTLTSWEGLNRAVIAGFFVAGIGTGISIDSAINTNPKDLASRDAIDRNAPNPKLCATYGKLITF